MPDLQPRGARRGALVLLGVRREREIDGEPFYRLGSHMPLNKNEMVHWQRHPDMLDLKCTTCRVCLLRQVPRQRRGGGVAAAVAEREEKEEEEGEGGGADIARYAAVQLALVKPPQPRRAQSGLVHGIDGPRHWARQLLGRRQDSTPRVVLQRCSAQRAAQWLAYDPAALDDENVGKLDGGVLHIPDPLREAGICGFCILRGQEEGFS